MLQCVGLRRPATLNQILLCAGVIRCVTSGQVGHYFPVLVESRVASIAWLVVQMGSGITDGYAGGASVPIYNTHTLYGCIDEVRIWDRCLSEDEVSSLSWTTDSL
jgi:hypothetical protein